MLKGISGNVLILGLVSFLTDVSSEMIYPLLPLFLTTVLGAGPAFLGIIEGIAESTSSLLKLVSGIWSDRVRDRKGFILGGYGLSSLARPLVAVATGPLGVLAVRFFDRVGKGIRTSPRDALIADSVEPSLRGTAFGFHRSMDHAGALVGPLIAAALLGYVTSDLRTIFWLSAIPGALAVLLIIFKVRDTRRVLPQAPVDRNFLRTIPKGRLRSYLIILLVFTLGNSSDTFLLLKAGKSGIGLAQITLLWTFFHFIKMSASLPFGALSDRIGRKGVIIAGWLVYAVTYFGFAHAESPSQIWGLFALYGLFYGLTEGVEKALLADIVSPEERGAAYGWYNCAIGIGALPASILFGIVWETWGAAVAFTLGAGLAGVAAVLLILLPLPQQGEAV
jgi:MFS family permease